MIISKYIEYIKKLFDKKGLNFVLAIGFIGIILLSYDDIMPKKKENTESAFSIKNYNQEIENNLTEILSSISGAGEVKVMVTMETGQENVYAWQEKTTQDTQTVSADISGQESDRYTYENEIVLINNGDEKQALVQKTLQPTVQGVVVVCEGADDIKVVSNITNAVSVALNITSNRICVIKMK